MALVHALLPPTSLAMFHPDGVSVSRKTFVPSPWKPASSTLNQFAPDPSQAHLYFHTGMGPWLCVHCAQTAETLTAETLSPGAAEALRVAEVPPLQRSLKALQERVGL